jgi:hypothetical protein
MFLDSRCIVLGQDTGMAEIPLPFGRLFGKNMAQVLFFVLNLACSGKRIALGGALLGFHLWHDAAPLNTGSQKF